MRDQSWEYSSCEASHITPTDTDFWLWQGHPKCFQPSGVPAEAKVDAASLALKPGKMQHRPAMQSVSTSAPGNMDEQQQQFMDYWSRQDDRSLSPYMPGYPAQESWPHSPALSSGLASSLREGNHAAHAHCLYFHIFQLCGP